MPPKVMITWADEPGTEERHGRIMAMPAYIGGEFDVAGLKWIPSVPDNPARNGLPRANALVLLTDPATGLPLAVMDGTVVLRRCGRERLPGWRCGFWPGADAEVACLLGAGVLAHTQPTRCLRCCRGCARCACTTRRSSAAAGSAPALARPPASTCGRPGSAEGAVRGGGRRAGDDGG